MDAHIDRIKRSFLERGARVALSMTDDHQVDDLTVVDGRVYMLYTCINSGEQLIVEVRNDEANEFTVDLTEAINVKEPI